MRQHTRVDAIAVEEAFRPHCGEPRNFVKALGRERSAYRTPPPKVTMITLRERVAIVSPFRKNGGTIRGAIDMPASFRKARFVRGNISVSSNLAAADLALRTAEIERSVIAS
jgi:hypothetical protein